MIKLITGFRDDQFSLIDDEDAHLAYYLFLHPEERAVFKNGVPMIGKNIQDIKPAWHEMMGWNINHKIDGDDMREIRSKGLDVKMNNLLHNAKQIAYAVEENPELLSNSLTEAVKLTSPKFKSLPAKH